MPLKKLHAMLADLKTGYFEAGIENLFRQALSKRTFDRGCEMDQSFLQLLPKLSEWLKELSRVQGVSNQERFSILLGMIEKSSWSKEENESDVTMHGWLELPWADAPNLLVLGCNDSFLPASLTMNSFIPQSLRRDLGLWTDEDRAGRDAYLLNWILASRNDEHSSVEFVLGKFSQDGSPLKPSLCFLFVMKRMKQNYQTGQRNFCGCASAGKKPCLGISMKLKPGKHEKIRHISVTSFRSFLSCPFRFYLNKKFKMNEYDAEKEEADVMDFGTLTHSALEVLIEYSATNPDEGEIYKLLCDPFGQKNRL